jgi:hypothetical protein
MVGADVGRDGLTWRRPAPYRKRGQRLICPASKQSSMVVFGQTEANGLMALFILIVGAAYTARALLRSRGRNQSGTRLAEKLDDFEEREEINRLRHRDFSAFLEKLNGRRKRLGQPALTGEYLEPHRFNLMYSVDAGDVDDAELEKLRRRVGKAAKIGDEPAAGAPSD